MPILATRFLKTEILKKLAYMKMDLVFVLSDN